MATKQKWSTKSYKLSEFLDRFSLPQTVKVVEGVFNNDSEQETICINDILIIHKHEQILRISATNSMKEVESLPLECDTRVHRVAAEFAQCCLRGRDILQHLSKVLFLRILEDDADNGLKRNEKLRINYDSVQNYGESFSFSLQSITDQSKEVEITQDSKTKFQPIFDANEYLISDIVRKFGLPVYVLFLDDLKPSSNSKSTLAEENKRFLKLESTFKESFATVSNILDPNTVFRLKRNIELSICPTLEAELQETTNTTCKVTGAQKQANSVEKAPTESSAALYEDMTSFGFASMPSMLETQESLQKLSQEMNCNRNPYTPTPSARVMKTFFVNLTVQRPRRRVYEIPKLIIDEQQQQQPKLLDLKQSPESWYNVPKPNITRCYGGPENINLENKHAQLTELKHVADEDNSPIYQEIDFREPPEELAMKYEKAPLLKSGKSKSEKESTWQSQASDPASFALSNRNSRHFNISRKWSLRKADFKSTEVSPNDCQLKAEGFENTKKPKDFAQKRTEDKRRQERSKVYSSGETVIYKRSLSITPHLQSSENIASMSSQQQKNTVAQRSHSVGCLEGNILENSITQSLAKNKLFASKSGKMEERPPLPPPRTSSIKPVADSAVGAKGQRSLSDLSRPDKHPAVKKTDSLYEEIPKATVNNNCYRKEKHLPSSRGRSETVPQIHHTVPPTGNVTKRDSELQYTSHKPKVEPRIKREKEKLPGQKFLSRSKTELEFATKSLKPLLESKPEKPASLLRKEKWSPKNKIGCSANATLEKPSTAKDTRERNCNTLPRNKSDKTDKDSFDIPNDLQALGVSGVSACLKKLNMQKLVDFFKDNLIDGEMLLALDEETMVEMGIEKLHRLKLRKFINGWRPSL